MHSPNLGTFVDLEVVNHLLNLHSSLSSSPLQSGYASESRECICHVPRPRFHVIFYCAEVFLHNKSKLSMNIFLGTVCLGYLASFGIETDLGTLYLSEFMNSLFPACQVQNPESESGKLKFSTLAMEMSNGPSICVSHTASLNRSGVHF